jgi:3-oxoacyl-[acyl-carrier protein] reductase
MNLKGKIAIVTGSSRGIGLAIAEALAAQGAHVVCSSTAQAGCEKVAAHLSQKFGVESIGIACDVSKSEDVKKVVDKTIEKWGQIDILVNNAGIAKDNLTMRMSDEEWSQVLRVNLDSSFYFSRAVLRPMLKKRAGRIINIASVVGVIGNPGQANYAASKAGVIGLTKSIAKEYATKNITVNAVAPGFIKTDMIESLPKDYLDNIMRMIPQGRLGEAKEVADLVAFLASDQSGYITGQVLQVDGGIGI